MPYASAGARELWFGARSLSVGLLCRIRKRDPRSRLLAAARRLERHGERRCDHLHDTVSRYDHAAKRLELLLTCPVCETEKVIHSLVYEPRFDRP